MKLRFPPPHLLTGGWGHPNPDSFTQHKPFPCPALKLPPPSPWLSGVLLPTSLERTKLGVGGDVPGHVPLTKPRPFQR